MSTLHRAGPVTAAGAGPDATTRAAHQAYVLLRTAFTVAPIAFGLDKFVGLLTDWPQYLARLAPAFATSTLPGRGGVRG